MNKNYEYNQGLPDRVASQINNVCYYVSRGVKPCSVMGFKDVSHAEKAVRIAKTWKLFTFIDREHQVCAQLYVFKYEIFHAVFEELTKKNLPLSEQTKHWVTGKLFGYSDAAIAEFLTFNVSYCENRKSLV